MDKKNRKHLIILRGGGRGGSGFVQIKKNVILSAVVVCCDLLFDTQLSSVCSRSLFHQLMGLVTTFAVNAKCTQRGACENEAHCC